MSRSVRRKSALRRALTYWNDIAFARRAIRLVWLATGINLQADFVRDPRSARSGRTRMNGDVLFKELPEVPAGLLPVLYTDRVDPGNSPPLPFNEARSSEIKVFTASCFYAIHQ